MKKAIIFDLDQTIVDSSSAEQYRKKRDWATVYRLIPGFTLYTGFDEVFRVINNKGIRCCIVTTAPGIYSRKIVNHFGIPCEFIVDYFSTNLKKPHAEPMLKALSMFNMTKEDVISFGDRAIDIMSSNAAGVLSVACLWGSGEKEQLINALPNKVINTPTDILEFL